MADYERASGALFKNRKKQTEKQPDYTGNIEIDADVVRDLMAQIDEGIEHPKADLSAWIKNSKAGMNFLSLNIYRCVSSTYKCTRKHRYFNEALE